MVHGVRLGPRAGRTFAAFVPRLGRRHRHAVAADPLPRSHRRPRDGGRRGVPLPLPRRTGVSDDIEMAGAAMPGAAMPSGKASGATPSGVMPSGVTPGGAMPNDAMVPAAGEP